VDTLSRCSVSTLFLFLLQALLKSHSECLLSPLGKPCSVSTGGYDSSAAAAAAGVMPSSLLAETSTMFNPLFHNMSSSGDGSMQIFSADSSAAGSTAAAGYGTASSTAADVRATSNPAADSTVQQASAAAAAAEQAEHLFEVVDNPMYRGRSLLQWLAKHSASGGNSSSSSYAGGAGTYAFLQPAAVQQSSFSVHSSQLSAMIRERVSTENLTISTEVAPDTSRFTLNSRGSSRTVSSSVADGTIGGSPSYARGHYNNNNAAGGLGDLAESLEIEYSQDGCNAPAAAAGIVAMPPQQQQQLQRGDFVYEFVPSVARDILSWSGLSDVSAASSFGTVGTLGTLHTTLGMGTLCGTATLAAAAGDAYDPAAAAAGLSGAGVGGGDKQQLDALLPKRWLAGKAGSAGVSASGDSSSKLARLANAEVGAGPVHGTCLVC
jgi:hypothetical protein